MADLEKKGDEKLAEEHGSEKGGGESKAITGLREYLVSRLKDLRISELKLNRKPIVLDSKTDPKKAIEVLLQNKVMAAPVAENNQFVGVFDLRDCIKYALQMYHRDTVDKIKSKAMEFLTISPHIATNSLKYLSRMRTFEMVKESESILSVIRVLAKGAHIVGITNEDGKKLESILTQGEVFQIISKCWEMEKIVQIEKDSNIALSELTKDPFKIVTTPVVTISCQIKAYEAFEKMSTSNLSGLAVVDKSGAIVHNTSATDIKLWLLNSNSLDDTIEHFLINVRKLSLLEKYPVTSCHLTDTLSRVIAKLQATKFHRIWIVDDHRRPTGVCAITDIFRFLH
ncbi:hypothetical protein RFI_34504 [Reticulomyxa filosa]|uniref:CBS domain-containing protein n=1 Tax=Reticulomyxa filosa TaxID=46433 RepID=X6LQB9_RETFI|nr:hypothetical protein RFI_34504 [Reticulomyxa filosa]|eukprot:ETO02910.1 hypothetical protein RFI_34504 [Reticulomyxa filosa]